MLAGNPCNDIGPFGWVSHWRCNSPRRTSSGLLQKVRWTSWGLYSFCWCDQSFVPTVMDRLPYLGDLIQPCEMSPRAPSGRFRCIADNGERWRGMQMQRMAQIDTCRRKFAATQPKLSDPFCRSQFTALMDRGLGGSSYCTHLLPPAHGSPGPKGLSFTMALWGERRDRGK